MEPLMVLLLFTAIFLPVLLVCMYIGVSIENKGYNGQICPNCGVPMEHFDTNSQGHRGYICKNCWYATWVSYKCVDGKRLYS